MPITNAQIAQDVSDLITKRVQIDTEFATWLSGPAGGGAGSDGKYPLTDYTGVTRLLESPDQLASGIGGSAAAAAASAAAALASENAAASSASAASTDEGLADAHRIAAIAAQAAAEAARDAALSAQSNATASQNAAATSEANAATSESNAATSETNAAASEAAAAASAAAAATFDPALYAALADNETVTGQYTFSHASGILIGAAPLTAALIGNWNTAYGWGDHAGAGYLTSFTETDPTVGAHIKAISSGQITNWDTAFSWGNHAGLYMTDLQDAPADLNTLTEPANDGLYRWAGVAPTNAPGGQTYMAMLSFDDGSQMNQLAFGYGNAANRHKLFVRRNTSGTWDNWTEFWSTDYFSSTDIANWNTAFGWGDHAGLYASAGHTHTAFAGLDVTGVLDVTSQINMENGVYMQWKDTVGTLTPLLTLWTNDDFYVGNGGHGLIIRGDAITAQGNATFDNTLTATGLFTATTRVDTDEIRCRTAQQLVLNAGESGAYATGQTTEKVFLNAENGLEVNSSPDNWGTLWAGRHTATICDAAGHSYFPGNLSLDGDIRPDTSYLDVRTTVAGATGVRVLDSAGVQQGYLYGSGQVFGLLNSAGSWAVQIAAGSTTVTFPGNVNANSGLDVTGNITVTGTVDGIDIAAIPTTYEPAFAKNNAFNSNQAGYGVTGVSYVTRTDSTSSAGQWITIATNPGALDITVAPTGAGGSRSTARFILTDQTSGRHETLEIYAACHYGQRPVLRVIGHHYGTQIWTKARIVNSSTYDGHALQVYCTAASTGFHVHMLENFQTPGWTLRNPPVAQVPEGTWSVAEECDTAGWNLQAGNGTRGIGVDMNGVLSLNYDTNSAKLSWNTVGQYGNLMISGDEHGAYLGVSLNNYSVFMDAQNGPAGIYNDTQNEWKIRFDSNASDVQLNYGGATRLATTSAGVSVTGDIAVTGTVDGIDIAALNTTVGTKAPSASPTFTGAVTMPEDVDFPYGIHGGYSSNASAAWGATIWSLDISYNGGEAAANSVNTSVYGIRWLRASHANAATSVGEGLYVYQNGVLEAGMGTAGIYSAADCYVTGEFNLGHLTDTSFTRLAAGKPGVEGKPLIKHASATYNSGEVTFSTAAPSGGADGDIWFQYT